MYFVPDGQGGWRTATAEEFGAWMSSRHDDYFYADGGYIVGIAGLPDGVYVSTVFLGLDHAFGGGSPILFETMIFGGPHSGYQTRARTLNEAMEQHQEAVQIAATTTTGGCS